MNITAQTSVLALFGDPVGHSLSPVMHNGWIDDIGADAVYIAMRVVADDPKAAFTALRAQRFLGANVTVPHKQPACLVADRLDPAASALGALNTLRWEEDGTISGYNTDAPGLIAALDESHAGWRSRTGNAVVMGAGGAARAAAWALVQAGVRSVSVANRTRSAADEIAALTPRCKAYDWADLGAIFESADLIVNCTSIGMKNFALSEPEGGWPLQRAPKHCMVMDAVYAPLETPLLRAARARGLIALDGLGLLIHQGVLAFNIWFGVTPDPRLARTRLMQAIAEREG